MATFINKGTWAAGTTSISPGIPASMQAGDFMILDVHTCNQAVTTPSGWTVMTTSPVSTGTANTAGGTRISSYYRWWQSGDAAPTVAVTSGTVTNGIIKGYRGVNPTTPFDATPVATTLATASTTLTMAGITTVTANALIHWSVARDQDLNSTTAVTAYTNANLTGITEIHDQVVNTGVGGGIWNGYGFKATAGATGNTTITQTSSIAVGLTIALRPAPNNYTLTCNGGSYALAGGSAVLTKSSNSTQGAIVQSVENHVSSVSDTTISVTINGVTAGNALVAFVGYGSGSGTNSITGVSDGTAYTAAADGACINSLMNQASRVFYLPNASSGNHTVTATFSSSISYRRIRVVEVSGIASSSAEDGAASQPQDGVGSTTDSISSSATSTTTNANDFVLGFTQNCSDDYGGSPPTLSAGTGFTLGSGTDNIMAVEGKNVTATGAQTATFSAGSNTSWTTHVLVLKTASTSGAYTLTAQGGSYSLTGGSATLKRDKLLTASGGSYTLTGQNANLVKGRVLTAQGGAYTLTGQNATVLRSKRIVAGGGSYALGGQSATLLKSKVLVASGGSYSYTGQSAVITWAATANNYTLIAQGGSYSLSGQSAILSRNRKLTSTGGSYTLSGQSATLLRSKNIVATGGVYTVNGQSATLLKSKKIVASGGSYSITGQSAILSRSKYLIAQGGTYSLTGGSAVITWTGSATNYTLICQGGSYTLLGASVGINHNRKLTVNGGSYTYTGSSATINRNRSLQAGGGTYTLTGGSAIILKSKYLVGSGGSYVYSGQSAVLTRSRLLQAVGGVYSVTGSSAVITYTVSGGYPNPADVLLGVTYGPTGTEYTGTLDIGKKFRIDIATGNIVMVIDSTKVMSL